MAVYLKMALFLPVLSLAFGAQVQAHDSDNEQLRQRIAELEQKLERMDLLEQRLNVLETTAVNSDLETHAKKVEIFVDDEGLEYETAQAGNRPVVIYQRESDHRERTLEEKIEDALASNAADRIQVGVDAAITMQYANQTKGDDEEADGEFYQLASTQLASTDLYFTVQVVKNTIF